MVICKDTERVYELLRRLHKLNVTVKTENSPLSPANVESASPLKREIVLIGKNSLVYVIGRALTHAVGFFMIPVYTRYILPSNYGAMELIEIISSVVIMIISLGVADSMPRYYYAEKDEEKRNETVSTIIIGFGLLAIPIVTAFMAFSGYLSFIIMDEPKYRYFLQVAIITVWFTMLSEVAFSYLRMLYMAKLFVVVTTLQLMAALSLNIWFVVFMKLDILGIFYSTLITQGITGILLSGIILKKVGSKVSFSLLKHLVLFGLPLVPSRIGLMIGFVSNRFFIRWLGVSDATSALTMLGLFALGHKFGVIVNRFINAPFNSFWTPRKMELLLSEDPDSKQTVARICTYATFLSVYAALGMTAGIESLIQILVDPKYYGAHVVVPFVASSYIALGLETHFSTGLVYRRKTIWATYASVIGLVVVLLWNYIFIPRYGLMGAATSNLAGFAVRTSIIYVVSQRFFHIPFEVWRIAHLFAIALGLYFSVQFINTESPWSTFFIRTGFAALYPLALYMTGFFSSGEQDQFNRFIGKIFIRQRQSV